MKHPIEPSPALIQHWIEEVTYPHEQGVGPSYYDRKFAILAAQWGADQELEACLDFVQYELNWEGAEKLYSTRRPKPESAKEKALKALNKGCFPSNDEIEVIKAALEGLP